MIGKVLFTLAVIIFVALIWRTRHAKGAASDQEPRLINPAPAGRSPLAYLAIAVVGLVLLTSAYLLYDYWRNSNEVIFIRVVDARSGRAVEYRAERGAIGDREFETVDGRRIVLAETERLETSTVRSPVAQGQN